MNRVVGWTLAFIALVAGWFGYGWPGLVLAFSVIVFWLLIQFSRSVRVMRDAGESPVGHVPSAVMLHSKLSVGQPMLQIVEDDEEPGPARQRDARNLVGRDDSDAEVRITFEKGVCARWTLDRPD